MPAAIPIVASVAGAVATSAMSPKASGSSGNAGSQTVTNRNEMDPRMDSIVYGGDRTLKPGVAATYSQGTPETKKWVEGGYDPFTGDMTPGRWETTPGTGQVQNNPDSDYVTNPGLINQIMGQLDKPQDPNLAKFSNEISGAMGASGLQNYSDSMDAIRKLQSSNLSAPSMNAAQAGFTGMNAAQGVVPGTMNAAQINAPSQNSTNLAPAFNDMIYGQAGNNPFLTGAIQKGINQSSNAFGNMLADTKTGLQDALTSIRQGAIINGQLGGTRQGIAEGKAIGRSQDALARAASQFGQNNTDAAVAAQAGAYDTDRNRALSAASGLNSNQYGVAGQNAQFQQGANQTNYTGDLSMAQANLGYQNQANQFNAGAANQNSQFNATSQNNAAQNNANWMQNNNQLNSTNQLNGINASNATTNNMYNVATNQDQYDWNKLSKTAGLISNFTGLGGSSSQTSPLYQNTAGNILGGATAGLGLANAFTGIGKGGGGGEVNSGGYNWAAQTINPYNYNSSNYG